MAEIRKICNEPGQHGGRVTLINIGGAEVPFCALHAAGLDDSYIREIADVVFVRQVNGYRSISQLNEIANRRTGEARGELPETRSELPDFRKQFNNDNKPGKVRK